MVIRARPSDQATHEPSPVSRSRPDGECPSRGDFSVGDVLAWARTKPADETYSFHDNENCALCQFLRETGRAAYPTAGGITWDAWATAPYKGGSVNRVIPEKLAGALLAGTFAELVARLEKLCPDAPVPPSEWTRLDAYMNDIELASA